MGFGKHIVFLCSVIVAVLSAQPNCEPDNQFRSYCFSIEYCNDFICSEHNCGRFILNAKLIKIKDAKIIPKCAFSNADELKYIHGANKNVRVIASGAFVNLPKMESLILSFNFIRELHHGTFKNVRLSVLDLSWNRIVYVQEGAFEGIQGLQYLNLSKNELLTLPVQRLSPSLIDLNLSYNFFNRLALNYARFPNLVNIDLSHNDLENVALFFEKPVEEIDLGHNHLKNIDLFEVKYCEKLKIPSNNFSLIPEFLKYSSIKTVALYPNPWKCVELQELWSYLQNNFITVEEESNRSDGGPVCSDETVPFSTFSKLTDFRQCDDDSHCAADMICRGSYCWSPCKQNVCDSGSICTIENHKFECSCPKNHMRDPRNIHSGCVEAECFLDVQCDPGNYCDLNHVCRVIPPGPPPSYPGAAAAAAGFGGSVETVGAPGSAGYGGTIGITGAGGLGGGTPGTGQFSGTVGNPGITTPTPLGPGPVESGGASGSSSQPGFNGTVDNPEQPWWYYEIPVTSSGNRPMK